ncbi:hypothetical protein LUW77_24785 [Streptomyces radiopugnans]|nr:hypothetical protein LUW77_24785 [Streptomyces radiopugnans]
MPATDTEDSRRGPRHEPSGFPEPPRQDIGRTAGRTAGGAGGPDDSDEMASGLDALESPVSATAATSRRLLAKAAPPLAAVALVLALWQTAYALNWSATLPSPAAVWGELAYAPGRTAPCCPPSATACCAAWSASPPPRPSASPWGCCSPGWRRCARSWVPSCPPCSRCLTAALVPVAVIALGNSEGAVYAVVLLGAVPSIAVGVTTAVDQIPPLLLRA